MQLSNEHSNISSSNPSGLSAELWSGDAASDAAFLAARADQLAQEARYIKYHGYRVGDLRLLARYGVASQLSEMLPIFRLPGVPAGFKGLVNLHGNVIPVFDLANWLGGNWKGVAHDLARKHMLLVLGTGSESVAVIVDGLPVRKRFLPNTVLPDTVLPDTEIEVGHESALQAFAIKAYSEVEEGEQQLWIELDERRLFARAAAS